MLPKVWLAFPHSKEDNCLFLDFKNQEDSRTVEVTLKQCFPQITRKKVAEAVTLTPSADILADLCPTQESYWYAIGHCANWTEHTVDAKYSYEYLKVILPKNHTD